MSKLQKAPCTAAMAFCAAALLSSASAGADDSSAGAADKPDSSSPLSLSGYAVRSYMAVGGVISAIRPFAGLTLTDGSRKLSVDVCNGSPVIPTYLCDATVGETLKISGDVSVSVKVGLIAHSLWEHDGDKSGLLVGANRYLAYSQYLGYRPYANSDGLGGQLELRYGGDSSTLLSYTRASGYLPSGMPSNDL